MHSLNRRGKRGINSLGKSNNPQLTRPVDSTPKITKQTHPLKNSTKMKKYKQNISNHNNNQKQRTNRRKRKGGDYESWKEIHE